MEASIVSTIYDVKEFLKGVFADKQQEISLNDTPFVAVKRTKAFELFNKMGFPHAALEKWRGTDLSRALNHEYHALPEPPSPEMDIDKIFTTEEVNYLNRIDTPAEAVQA